MPTWSGIRKKLEQEYLAPCLRGRVQYYATTYKKSHDHEGRASIRLDGREILSGCYYNNWVKQAQFPRDETFERRCSEEFAYMDETALRLGVFDQRCFYAAFRAFDGQSLEESLQSEDLLVRVFALLDRRLGKRRLLAMRETISEQPETIRQFYAIRTQAEGLSAAPTVREVI